MLELTEHKLPQTAYLHSGASVSAKRGLRRLARTEHLKMGAYVDRVVRAEQRKEGHGALNVIRVQNIELDNFGAAVTILSGLFGCRPMGPRWNVI
jgi:hypothetical protein